MHTFPFYQCLQKDVWDFFFVCLFYLDVELLAKIKNDLFSTHSLFAFLLITQDPNKKNPAHALVDIVRYVCKMSTKNIKPYGSWSSLIVQTNSHKSQFQFNHASHKLISTIVLRERFMSKINIKGNKTKAILMK